MPVEKTKDLYSDDLNCWFLQENAAQEACGRVGGCEDEQGRRETTSGEQQTRHKDYLCSLLWQRLHHLCPSPMWVGPLINVKMTLNKYNVFTPWNKQMLSEMGLYIVQLESYRSSFVPPVSRARNDHGTCGTRQLVSQAIPFAERGRIWSRCNHRVVTTAETCQYQSDPRSL